MSNFKYDHVGRPSNEEVAKKKNIAKFKIVLSVLFVFVISVGIYLLINYDNLNFSSIMGNSVVQSDFSKRKNTFRYGNSLGRSVAIQGAVGRNGGIYYSTSKAGSQKMDDYQSKIYTYNVTNSNIITDINGINKNFEKYNNFKNNDMTLRYDDNMLYFINFNPSNEKNKYSLIFKEGDDKPYKTQELNKNNSIKNYSFSNIAYSIKFKKFVSLSKNYIYFYNLVDNNGNKMIDITSKCPLDNSLKEKNVSYTLQGIDINNNITGYMLYLTYQTRVGNKYNNHINLYDLRNCTKSVNKRQAKLVQKFDLGYSDYKYELENMFFMNGDMYLGYNNKAFNYISFYSVDISNKATVSLSIMKENGTNYLIAKTNNSNNGYLYYSFCKSADYRDCKLSSFRKENGYNVLKFKEIKLKKEIKEKGTYYFHTYDNFGKRRVSNPVVVK